MHLTQAKRLTDAQIEATYDYFENGKPPPAGVKMQGSFTTTMGRYVVSDSTGTRRVVH